MFICIGIYVLIYVYVCISVWVYIKKQGNWVFKFFSKQAFIYLFKLIN